MVDFFRLLLSILAKMDWRYNTVWFDQIPKNIQYHQDLKEEEFDRSSFQNAEYAVIWHFKKGPTPFDKIPGSDKLKYLEFNWANFKSLDGIDKFPNLKRLELHYCTKLESFTGVENIHHSLEYLHINQSKKLRVESALSTLKNLKVLCLNNCGDIRELDFLSNFPELIDFRFVDTNVLSGNLTPILKHPTLKSIGFLNKRHYNYKFEVLSALLNEKINGEFKDTIYKGEYKTFKYKAFN